MATYYYTQLLNILKQGYKFNTRIMTDYHFIMITDTYEGANDSV